MGRTKEIRFSYNGDAISPAALAKLIKDKHKYANVALSAALVQARVMLAGEDWCPDYYSLHDPEAPGPWNIVVTEVKDEQTQRWEERCAEYQRGEALAARGAAGDAEAAIEFCKVWLTGAMANHAMG